jgi:hypothetical protein
LAEDRQRNLAFEKDMSMDAEFVSDPRPYWIDAAFDIDSLPEGLRLAISEIVVPAYRQLVLEASDALERATGATYVHLLWEEILDQFELEKEAGSGAEPTARSARRMATMDRLLRIIGAKQKAANFLLRLRTMPKRRSAAGVTFSPVPPMEEV